MLGILVELVSQALLGGKGTNHVKLEAWSTKTVGAETTKEEVDLVGPCTGIITDV